MVMGQVQTLKQIVTIEACCEGTVHVLIYVYSTICTSFLRVRAIYGCMLWIFVCCNWPTYLLRINVIQFDLFMY